MGRLRAAFIERVDLFSNRVLDVTEVLENQGRSRRIVDQLIGSGTSVGANTSEADEAMSRKDFAKSIGTVLKELAETRFWLRTVARRAWASPDLVGPLQQEALELKLIFGSMLARIRRNDQRDTQQ